MEHNLIKEKLQMYFFDELKGSEKIQIEKHLEECEECRKEIVELQRLRVFLSMKKKDVPETLLNEARQELKARIRVERKNKSLNRRIIDIFSRSEYFKPVYAFGVLAVFAAGLLIGFLMFNSSASEPIVLADNNTEAVERITNVKFINFNENNGEVEFSFNAVRPVKLKGNLNDNMVKSVLMHAMLNEDNPGVRLNTVNFINESRRGQVDPEVKAAVLTVAKYDNNPGVRKEAFTFIRKLPFDEDIKAAYLYVLMNDSVSGLRIEAINGLFEASQEGELFTKEELSVFKETVQQDENSYIRLRAQTVLKEYN